MLSANMNPDISIKDVLPKEAVTTLNSSAISSQLRTLKTSPTWISSSLKKITSVLVSERGRLPRKINKKWASRTKIPAHIFIIPTALKVGNARLREVGDRTSIFSASRCDCGRQWHALYSEYKYRP